MFFSIGFSRCRLLCELFCPTCGDCYAIATSHRTGRGKNICVVFEICPWGRLRISRAQIVTSGLASSSVQSETITSSSTATLGSPFCLGHGFSFLKNADSNVAPPPYLGTAVGAGYETVFLEWSGTTNLLLPHLRHLRGASGMARAVHSG